MNSCAEEVSRLLARAGAVIRSPSDQFVLSNGERSPIYIDCRKLLSFPNARGRIVYLMRAMIVDAFGNDVMIAGIATAGISWAALVADRINARLVYVRGHPKNHGTCLQIEGLIRLGSRVVLIDDTATTGASIRNAVSAITDAGGDVIGAAVIVSRMIRRENTGCDTLLSLCKLDDVELASADPLKGLRRCDA